MASAVPIIRAPEQDVPQPGKDDCTSNHFTFANPSTMIAGTQGKCEGHDAIVGQSAGQSGRVRLFDLPVQETDGTTSHTVIELRWNGHCRRESVFLRSPRS